MRRDRYDSCPALIRLAALVTGLAQASPVIAQSIASADGGGKRRARQYVTLGRRLGGRRRSRTKDGSGGSSV